MIGTTRPSHQRFPTFAGLLLLAAACSGGGGGSSTPNTAPTLVTAAFVGATSTPAANDTLYLFFSEDIALVGGKLLTDADVTISDGKSLGDVTSAPTLSTARSLAITLGAGVTLVPGSTTVTLSASNDVVSDVAGKLGAAATAVTIGTSDGVAPTIANVTISAIDDELNGTGPAGGTLQVPPKGWTIDLTYSDNGAIATSQTQITANLAVSTASGSQPIGTNLTPFLTTISATNTAASYRVPTTVSFPTGNLTLSVSVVDASGLASAASTFACKVHALTDALRPFETSTNAQQVWYLDFSRDVEQFTTAAQGGGVTVNVSATPNNRSDFEDILHVLGLLTSSPIANVSGSLSSNDVVLSQWKDALLAELGTLFDGANITFTLTQPSGSFGGNSSVAYNSLGYSQISIAGSASVAGVLGVAIFDPNNTTQNDDTKTNFGSGGRLGIFLHTIADVGMSSVSSSTFRQTFNPLAPSLGGTAIGGDSQDGNRLLGTVTDGRADDIATAIADFARFTAVVLAHECGHSMGLVQNGAMPTGLYGNDATNFPTSPSSAADGHIRNTSLFPAGSTNVMSPSLSYTNAINANTAFNRLNLAYLREQVLYGN